MKIVICGSMKLSQEMIKIAAQLRELRHEVTLPRHTEKYATLQTFNHIHNESVKNKINDDLIRGYYHKIAENDAVLIVNDDLNGITGYIGGNSFLEISFAHVLQKNIFLLNPIPEMSYQDEIIAMQPIVINNDLSRIN